MVLLSAGLSFSAAWAFKQSTVGIFVGVCLHALLRDRNIRGATLVAVPVVVTASLSLLLGGRLYRLNALTLPTVTQFDHLRVAWLQLVQVLATHVYLWLVPLLWILVVARSGVRLEARERSAV